MGSLKTGLPARSILVCPPHAFGLSGQECLSSLKKKFIEEVGTKVSFILFLGSIVGKKMLEFEIPDEGGHNVPHHMSFGMMMDYKDDLFRIKLRKQFTFESVVNPSPKFALPTDID
jgi:hypothetical protein